MSGEVMPVDILLPLKDEILSNKIAVLVRMADSLKKENEELKATLNEALKEKELLLQRLINVETGK